MESSDSSQDQNSVTDVEDTQNIITCLKQDKERLTERIQSLQSQLKQTLEFQIQNEELLKQNTKLQADLRSAKATIEDLSSRLAINIKINEELKLKSEIPKQNGNIDLPSGVEVLDLERRKFAKQIAKLNADMASKEDLFKRSQEENTNLQNEINKIIKKSQEKFNTVFKDTNELLTYLQTLPDNSNLEETTNVPEAPPLFDERLIRKIEKLKKDLKTEKKERSKAENQVKDLIKQFKDAQDIANEKLSAANEEIQETRHQASMDAIEFNHQIDQLKQENQTLKQMNGKLQGRLESAERDIAQMQNSIQATEVKAENKSLKKEVDHLTRVIQDKDQSIATLKSQVEVAQNKSKADMLQNDSNKRKLAKAQEDISSLTAEKDALSCEKRTVTLQKTALEEQNRSLTAKNSAQNVQISQLSSQLEQNRQENEKYKDAVSALEKNLQNQKREIQSETEQKEKLLKLVQKQIAALTEMEQKFDSLSKDNKQLTQKLKTATDKLNEELEKPPAQIDIPVTAWFNKEFPKELCQQITDYAKNEAIEATTKLRKVLQAISTYYNAELSREKRAAQSAQKDAEETKEKTDEYLSQLGALFNLSNLTTESVVHNCCVPRDLLEKIQKLQDQSTESQNSAEKVSNDLNNIIAKLEVKNVEEADLMISKLYDTINSLQKDLSNEHANLSKAMKVLKAQEKQFSKQASEFQSEIDDLQSRLRQSEASNKISADSLAKSEERIKNLNTQLENQAEIHKEDKRVALEEKDAEIKKLSERLNRLQTESADEITKKVGEIHDLKAQLATHDRDVQHLKQSIAALEEAKRQKDVEMQHLIDKHDESEKELRKNNLREKESLKEQYDMCLAEMRKENQQLSESHNESTAALEEANKRVNDLTQKLVSSHLQIDDLKSRVEMITEETERQIKITEMKTRSTLMSQEMHYKNLIEDNKSEFNTEKRKVIGFVAQQFRQYFDAHLELDDNCLRTVVKTVKLELDRLAKQEVSLRKIMGISSSQSLEESAAKLVLDIYCTN